jgi:hypothetical protein
MHLEKQHRFCYDTKKKTGFMERLNCEKEREREWGLIKEMDKGVRFHTLRESSRDVVVSAKLAFQCISELVLFFLSFLGEGLSRIKKDLAE